MKQPSSTPNDFFNKMLAKSPVVEPITFVIAGLKVGIIWGSSTLEQKLSPALNHLRNGGCDGPWDLMLHAWDSESTGIEPEQRPWADEAHMPGGKIAGFQEDGIAIFCPLGHGILSMVHFQRGEAVFWCRSARQLPPWEPGSPFRTLLSLWLVRHGRFVLHASCVARNNIAYLFVGPSGAGKSTTSVQLLGGPFSFLGDDYCIIDEKRRVWSLYNSFKLRASDLGRLTSNLPDSSISLRHRQKSIFFMHEIRPDCMREQASIGGFFCIHKTPKKPSIERCSSHTVLINLLPSTLFQHQSDQLPTFQALTTIVRKVPHFTLAIPLDRLVDDFSRWTERSSDTLAKQIRFAKNMGGGGGKIKEDEFKKPQK